MRTRSSDAERREHVARVDRMEQTSACVDRRRNRAKMIVEFVFADRLEQRALWIRRHVRRHRPVACGAASGAIGHREGWSPCARTDWLVMTAGVVIAE